jgi:SAM-dependent methyltransferase
MSAAEAADAEWWRGALNAAPLRDHAGRLYFTEVPADAFTDTQEDVPPHRWSAMRRSHYDWLKRELDGFPVGRRLVDIGCGQSQFADLLSRHRSCGIDFYPYRAAKVVADLNAGLPFGKASCEIAVLSNVLEHIYEPKRLLAETRRILEPGGTMLVVVPFFIKLHQPPYDFYRYTGFALDRMCCEAGFTSVRVEPIGNVFDVIEVDRSIRAKVMRRETTGLHRIVARALLHIERHCDRLMLALLPYGTRERRDADGYPQSFAVLARA